MANLEIHFAEDSFDVIGLDYAANLQIVNELQKKYPKKIVQGNFDPGALLASKEDISKKTESMIQ